MADKRLLIAYAILFLAAVFSLYMDIESLNLFITLIGTTSVILYAAHAHESSRQLSAVPRIVDLRNSPAGE
jgi:hypothetical protein